MDNYNKEKECWVVVRRGRPTDNRVFWYIDAVELFKGEVGFVGSGVG